MKDLIGTDVYLIDQILKGRYLQSQKILDAGCGSGRNMRWFALNGYAVFGCDVNPDVIDLAQENTRLSSDRFTVCPVEKMGYADKTFDHIICNAVLHFAKSEEHFMQMIGEMDRVLKPNGMLFIRMTSTFGLPLNYQLLGNGRYFLADGSERFLLTETLLSGLKSLGFEQIEPVKSVLVEELRSMSTLVLRKREEFAKQTILL